MTDTVTATGTVADSEQGFDDTAERQRLGQQYPTLFGYSNQVTAPARDIVGREYQISQLMAAMNRPELCNALLLAPAGSGKSHPDDTLIAVNDERGYIRIGDAVIGDEIFDEDGAAASISGVFPQGKKRVFKVVTKDGSQTLCNDEHIWSVKSRDDRKRGNLYREMTLREIMDRGVVLNDGSYRWTIPVGKAVQRSEIDLPADPYAVGALIGDGCLAGDSSHSSTKVLTVSSQDEHVVRKIAVAIGAVDVVRSEHNYNWNFLRSDPYTSSRGVEVKYVQRRDVNVDGALDALFGKKSPDRRIPEVYFTGSVNQRMELLRGLFDSDGTVGANDRTVVSFSTMGEGLAYDVKRLLASVGIRSTVSASVREGKSIEYAVFVKLPDRRKHELFSLPRHVETIEDFARYDDRTWHKNYDEMAIVSIEDLGYETDQTCIMVDNDSHLYQVGREHVVTHNTALVQAAMLKDTARRYLEVDVARMIADVDTADQMAATIKKLFDDAESFARDEGAELVLFMDEFHQIVQLSAASVEALKPVLAASGARGIRIIAATTFEEFHTHIRPNQPLVERLQRINVPPPDQSTTVNILHGMAKRYGVGGHFYDDHLFQMIYEYTNRYIPASSQPRKSILVLDAMVGWSRETGRPMDKALLADVLMESTGINVSFRVDATKIRDQLDSKVLGQRYATAATARRLQLCVADLHDKTKPMSSFLFTGSTGVGKTELTKQLAKLLFGDDQNHLIRFDMSEYARDESLSLFRSELTKAVWNMGHAVLLFDEIEKAASEVIRVLLQLLDDGRLSDDNGRQVSFLNTYIVMTTNAGSEIYETIAQYNVDDEGSGREMVGKMKEIKRAISKTQKDNKFPPELLGRIDQIVPFQPLSLETQRRIVRGKLRSMVQEVLTKHGARVHLSSRVLQYLVDDKVDTDASAGGARGAIQLLTDDVMTEVAAFVNAHPNERAIAVDINGVMKSDDEYLLNSDAYVEVKSAGAGLGVLNER